MTTICDWSMYQSDFHGDPNSADLYDPAHWTVTVDFAAVARSITGVIIRVGISTVKDPCFDRYLAGLKAAGVPWGIYHAYNPAQGSVAQADKIKGWCPETPPLGVWGDLEMDGGNYPPTNAYLHTLDMHYGQATGIYSGGPYMNSHYTAEEQSNWLGRPTWWAGYPNFITPAAWVGQPLVYWWHQYTNAYQLPGLAKPCDASTLNPAMSFDWGKPMPYPVTTAPDAVAGVTHGSKIGLHSISPNQVLPLVKRAAAIGWRWPVVKFVNDPSPAPYIKAIDPRTITIIRYMPGKDDEGMQNVQNWTVADRQAWAARLIALFTNRTTATQRAAIDYYDPLNEPGAHGVDVYTGYGLALLELVRQANTAGLKLSVPALPQGTPEWDEMQALCATGLFAAMKAGGHIFDCHEGVYGGDPIDKYYGDQIPGTAAVPGAGAYNFRHRYLYSILEQRGEVVPLVVSEFYDGGGYPGDMPGHVARFAWYDARARETPYLLGFCGFTIDPDDHWRPISDYTPFYQSDELWAYLAAEKDKDNMPVTLTDADYAATVLALNQASTILQKYAAPPAHVWKAGDVAVAVANPLITYNAPGGTIHDQRANVSYDLNVIAVSADGLWLEVAPLPLWVRTADVKLKA